MCEDLVPIFHMCEDLMTIFHMWEFDTNCSWYRFSHVGGFDTDSSHLWKSGTNSSHVSNSMPVLHRYDTYVPNLHTLKYGNVKFEHKFYPPKMIEIDRAQISFLPKVTYCRTIGTNSSHGVQFTKCEIRRSNLVSWKRIISRLPCDFFKKDKKKDILLVRIK